PGGLMEQLEPAAVARLGPRSLDQLVEGSIGERALVGPTVGLEQQAEEVLGIRVPGEPPRYPQIRLVGSTAELRRLLRPPRPVPDRDGLPKDLTPRFGERREDLAPHLHP